MPKKTTYRSNKSSVGPVRKEFQRATYYLTASLIKRLKHRAIDDGTDASATVRAALEKYLGPV